VRATGHVACFGHSTFGELGRANATDPPCAAPIFYEYPGAPPGAGQTCAGDIVDMTAIDAGVQALALGELHSCVVVGGHAKCWGTNFAGELGAPVDASVQPSPEDVVIDDAGTPLGVVSALAAGGGKHTCALLAGKVSCWGGNASGELGADPALVPSRAAATTVAGLDGVASIGVGDGVSCAVKTDGSVWCWGADDVGQLGDGVPKPFASAPVQVKGPANVGFLASATEVAPGRRHVCVRLADATAWCWGKNDRGQLGDGTGVDSLYPVKVKGL
jgi:alpha-tubulin suppressor-like RCC1 family protein